MWSSLIETEELMLCCVCTADYLWQTTAEGDWIVLMLQTARFLIKSLNQARKGKPGVLL